MDSSTSSNFDQQRYGDNNPNILTANEFSAGPSAASKEIRAATGAAITSDTSEQHIVGQQTSQESSMKPLPTTTPAINLELMRPGYLQNQLHQIEEKSMDGSQGTSRASQGNNSCLSMRNYRRRASGSQNAATKKRMNETSFSRNQYSLSSDSSSSHDSDLLKKQRQRNRAASVPHSANVTEKSESVHQNIGDATDLNYYQSIKLNVETDGKKRKNTHKDLLHSFVGEQYQLAQPLHLSGKNKLAQSEKDYNPQNFTTVAVNNNISNKSQNTSSLQFGSQMFDHGMTTTQQQIGALPFHMQRNSSDSSSIMKQTNKLLANRKQKYNKAGTVLMSMQEDKKMTNGSEKRKAVKSTASRGTRFNSVHQPAKSVSHALSPIVMDDGNSELRHSRLVRNDLNRQMDEAERLNQRIIDGLEPPPTPINQQRALLQQLVDLDCSIEGNVDNIDPSDASKVRNYLIKYQEYAKENAWKLYSEREVKDYPSLKSILSRRSQFNDTKIQFHNQLQKRFPMNEQAQSLVVAKDQVASDKLKKRTSDQHESLGCWQRMQHDYEEKLFRIKDEFSFEAHGKKYKFSKNSLGFLSNKSRVRIAIVWIVTAPLFDKIILLLIIGNSICLGAKDYLDPENLTDWNKNIDMLDPYFTVAFCIECVLKILAMGFFMGKGAYLKDVWNWLDFIVVVSSVLEIWFPSLNGLKIFKLFRPLRSLNNVKSMKILVDTLFKSMMSLSGIMGLAIFLFTIFAILGISQWRGLSHYRCRLTEFPVDGDWPTVPDDLQPCQPGIRECPEGTFCGSLLERDHDYHDLYAVDDLYRDSNILELNYGVTNFDNLGSAFLTIFQCITMEGWTTVMYMYQDLAFGPVVVAYFMSCVIICSFFLLNLTIAVMLMQYDELEQKNSNSFHKIALKNIGKDGKLPAPLVDFIIKEQNITIGKEALKEQQKLKKKPLTLCSRLLETEYVPMPDHVGYYKYILPRFFFAIAKSNFFGIIVMICIILNTLVLSLDRYPEGSQTEKEILSYFNMVFNIVFTAEVVIKMTGLGLNRYLKSVENIFDFLVVGMSWVELALGSEGGSSLGALRAVRLFRVFKLMKSGNLRILMDSILFTISTIGPYTVLLMLFLYVFALAGMNFFAGNFRFLDHGEGPYDKENGEVPRHNFDTLFNALLTTFACFIGDNWTLVMYDAMRSSGSMYALFFISVIAFGNIVMLNLFLAILLGNFDKARDFGSKKKLLECFLELRGSGRDLSECLDLILHEQEEYIKFSILKWDRRIVKLEKDQRSSFMRYMLEVRACFMEKMDYTFEHKLELPARDDDDDDGMQSSAGSQQDLSNRYRRRNSRRSSIASRPDIQIQQLQGQSPETNHSKIKVNKLNSPAGSQASPNKLIELKQTQQEYQDLDFKAAPDKGESSSVQKQNDAKLRKSSFEESDILSPAVKPSIKVRDLKSQKTASDNNKSEIDELIKLKEAKITSRGEHIEDNEGLNEFNEEQNSERFGDAFGDSQMIRLLDPHTRSESTTTMPRAQVHSFQPNMLKSLEKQDQTTLPPIEMCKTEKMCVGGSTRTGRDGKIERFQTQKYKEKDPRFCSSNLENEEFMTVEQQSSPTGPGRLCTVKNEKLKHDLSMLAVASQLHENSLALQDRNQVKRNQVLAVACSKSQISDAVFASPTQTDSKRKTLYQSIIGVFRSSKAKQNQTNEQAQLESQQNMLKVLRPCMKNIERSNECRDLDNLISDSKLFIVGDNQDYHLHLDDSMMGQDGQSKLGSMVLHQSLSPERSQISPGNQTFLNTPVQNADGRASRKVPFATNSWSPASASNARNDDFKLPSPSSGMKPKSMSMSLSKSSRRSPDKSSLRKRRRSMYYTNMTSQKLEQAQSNDFAAESMLYDEQNRNGCCKKLCSRQCWEKVKNHCKNSSLLIFHRDSKIRKFCLKFLKAPVTQKSGQLESDESQKLNLSMASMRRSMFKTENAGALKDFDGARTGNFQLYQTDNSLSISPTSRKLQKGRTEEAISSRRQSIRARKSSTSRSRSNKSKMRRRSTFRFDSQASTTDFKQKSKCAQFCMIKYPYFYYATPNKWFDNTILLLIFTSSVMLTLDSPLVDPESTAAKVYAYIDMIHTILFTFEMLIKMIGLGFFTNNFNDKELTPYFKTTWNILDFFVVISSLVELLMPLFSGSDGSESLKSLKALRALRALRPLRMVSKNEGMKIVVKALMTSLPGLTNVIVVCMLLLLILAIVGVNLFKGQFYSCQGLESEAALEAVDTKQDCLDAGGMWKNQDQNFDNVANAISSLFQMMTTEGWQKVMYNGMDARGVDLQPKMNSQVAMSAYFVAYMIIGSQFIINLFVGVVIDNFNKIKYNEEMGNCFVTHDQKQWIEIQKICLRKNLVKAMVQPKGYQKTFTNITENPWFEHSITFCIVLNTIAMAIVHYQQSEALTQALEILNYIFAFVFNVEMILKLLAQGRNYFRQGWNVFDCFIVFGTDFGILINIVGLGNSMGGATQVIRGFRIMRIFRLIKASIAIRLLIDTIMNILPQITNIMSLMGILLFIYAALGLNLFSQVMFQDQLNEKNNFQSFGNAMILLMRCTTGEDWNLVMYELANTDGYDGVQCREQTYEEQQKDGILGCGSSISFIYFFSFVILITMLILNLSVAAVIQGLDAACQENLGFVSSDDIDHFISLWKYYDPKASGWIGAEALIYLLIELPSPLGRKKEEKPMGEDTDDMSGYSADRYFVQKEKKIVIKKVKALAMLGDGLKLKTIKDDSFIGGYKVHFKEVLFGLLKRIQNEQKKDYKIKGVIRKTTSDKWRKKYKDHKSHPNETKGTRNSEQMKKLTAEDLAAGRIILTWFMKKRQFQNKMPEMKKTINEMAENFKETQREMARIRTGIKEHNEAKKQNKALAESPFFGNQLSARNANLLRRQNAEPQNEHDKKGMPSQAEQNQLEAGQKIIDIINEEQKKKKTNLPRSKIEEVSPRIKQIKSGNFKIKPKQSKKNMVGDDILTWNNKDTSARLLLEVEEEEAKRKAIEDYNNKQQLPFLPKQVAYSSRHEPELVSDSSIQNSQNASSNPEPRLARSTEFLPPFKASISQDNRDKAGRKQKTPIKAQSGNLGSITAYDIEKDQVSSSSLSSQSGASVRIIALNADNQAEDVGQGLQGGDISLTLTIKVGDLDPNRANSTMSAATPNFKAMERRLSQDQ